MKRILILSALVLSAASVIAQTVHYPEEKHLKNVKQLTFGGDNAEAYWSFDGKMVSFQSNNKAWGLSCDQIFYMPIDGMDLSAGQKPKLISTGKGRTTCAYFMPNNKQILYASTHLGGDACPPEPARVPGGKYLWPIYETFDIFISDLSGKTVKQLTNAKGYDAEATLSPDGKQIVFTSTRNGDLDLYVMDIKGKKVKQITNQVGYDGGAFFSPDGKKLVFRASRPNTEEKKKEYLDNLKNGLVAPTEMEIYTCNVDGSDLKQITKLGKANWAPFYHPDGKKIIFSSNHKGTRGFEFNLFMVNEDGTSLEQITFDKVFDSFPMFSPDGKKIIFSSNRNNHGTRDTNLFVADWVDEVPVGEEKFTRETVGEVIFVEPVQEVANQDPEDVIYTVVEESTTPAEGMGKFKEYLKTNLVYPKLAKEKGIEGKVYVQFVVEKDGTIQDPNVIKGLGNGCDEEAVRLIKNAAKWKPAKQNGKVVKQRFVMPVEFKLKP